jgi:lipopolysaccharide transport system ATP-binding protein
MPLIKLENVTVQLPVYANANLSFKKVAMGKFTGGKISGSTPKNLSITALSNISIDLKSGDRLGVIGPNGSGKSTLLRTIAGIYKPTSGLITVKGSISSLIDISLGMDQEATGYENIRMRGALMGHSISAIKKLEGEIADFTELGPYLSMPIRTYSTGMHMRLGFAVSTAFPADIVLLDEWLSVGDGEFSRKAEQRLVNFINNSEILVIASHSQHTITTISNKILNLADQME